MLASLFQYPIPCGIKRTASEAACEQTTSRLATEPSGAPITLGPDKQSAAGLRLAGFDLPRARLEWRNSFSLRKGQPFAGRQMARPTASAGRPLGPEPRAH